MDRFRDHAGLARIAVIVLTVAFAFALAHGLAPDHDHESHLADCAVCLWSQALFCATLVCLFAAGTRSRAHHNLADASPIRTILVAHSGRAPPIR